MAKILRPACELEISVLDEWTDYILDIIPCSVQEVMDPSPGGLQGTIGALAGNNPPMHNSLANVPINARQKRSRAETVAEEVISEARRAILREQAIRAANKKLKTKDKNSENTKVQRAKIQRDPAKRSRTAATKNKV